MAYNKEPVEVMLARIEQRLISIEEKLDHDRKSGEKTQEKTEQEMKGLKREIDRHEKDLTRLGTQGKIISSAFGVVISLLSAWIAKK